MKRFAVTKYEKEGGFEEVRYVGGDGTFQAMTLDPFSHAVRAISEENYQTIGLAISDFPHATVWLLNGEIRIEFPNPAE